MKLHEREQNAQIGKTRMSIAFCEKVVDENVDMFRELNELIGERERILNGANLQEFMEPVAKIKEEFGLTDIEYLQGLNQIEANTLKYCLRHERHPDDPNKPAGLE